MRFNSSKSLPLVIAVIFALSLGVFVGQSSAQKKKRTTAKTDAPRTLTQPEAEKQTPPVEKTQKTTPPPAANRAKKVMITDFDSRGIAKWWGNNWDIGSLFANSVVGPLSRSQSYEVVERSRMNELFAEQGLLQDERFNQSSVTKIGRLLGADYIFFGYLTDFTRKKSNKIIYKEVSAQIAFSARLVDVATGKVVKSVEISYVSPKQKDISLSSEQELNPNDPEFLQSIFGKAIKESVGQAVAQLTGEQVEPPTVVMVGSAGNNKSGGNKLVEQTTAGKSADGIVRGKVADITGSVVTINRGRQHGVKEGQFFAVVRVLKEIKDPDTGQVISQKTEELARLRITKVDASASEATLVSGGANALDVGTDVVLVIK
jgi:curli biogenesis system outer membrane secretion channel CsgG